MIEIKVDLSQHDIDFLYSKQEYYSKIFNGFEIIGRKIIPDDETTEYDEEPIDFYEVTLKMQSMNHFWTLAKRVGYIQHTSNFGKK